METYFINRPNLDRLAGSLSKTYRVYAPIKEDGKRFYKKINDDGLAGAVIGEIRAVQSIKSFFFPVREKIAEYFSENISDKRLKPVAIIGAKSCDLASLKVMDYVFKQDSFQDPSYIASREEGLIISSDCTCFADSCFCMALGILPYPTEAFDLNLSEFESGYIVEVGSEKGERIVKEHFKFFQNPDLYLDRQEENRNKLKLEIDEHVRNKKIPQKDTIQSLFKKKIDSSLWEETAKTCVECGACNVICPACHCFTLNDQKTKDSFERLRLWDSCLLMSFARVAGGGNPRKLLAQRLRNRFYKKFNFFPQAIGVFGCTGCGRCSEACCGKIYIQEVLAKLND
ncbi:MAG: 4Fe-4S dicluster domain-containing protein [Candidatus Omnitrophota bacterium]|nr:4Fe-4S dicluster domain-containing protein [Candidatus Omnitrophota bacterium]